jgi:hypothetical protein
MVSAEQRSPLRFSPLYKAFVTTTGCSVPALRFGGLALAAGLKEGQPSFATRNIRAALARPEFRPG